jgi:hypothetical protein
MHFGHSRKMSELVRGKLPQTTGQLAAATAPQNQNAPMAP